MAISIDQLLYAIRMIETSGRKDGYSIVNSIGAVGAYQVMKANVPSWTKQALGHSMTWQDFRDSPAAQDAVARYKLGGYLSKYGAEGAAAMWFSGQPNPNSMASDGGSTVRQYVNDMLKYAGQAPSSVSSSGGKTSVTSTTPASIPMTPGETAESYGFVQALFNSNAELRNLFNQAVSGQWTPQKFQAALRDTRWWKSTPQSGRDFLVLQYGDPATATRKLQQMQLKVTQLAHQIGLSGDSVSNKNMNDVAMQAIMNNWSDQQLRNQLGQRLVFWSPTAHLGEAGQMLDKLQQYSYEMGIKNTGSWYTDWARKIVAGNGSEQDAEDALRQQAKTLFPQWSKQLDAGQKVSDLASPYLQSYSTILEVPPGSVNLFDPLVRQSLQYKDPKTGENTVKPLWQFETDLRSDPRWKQTKNAQDSMMQVAHQVLTDFGVKR